MKKISVFFASLLCTTALTAEVVKDFKISGNSRVEHETILSYLPFKRGNDVGQLQLDQGLKDLFATGYFKDVTLSMDAGTIVVVVEENPIINQVAYEGNSKLKDDVIRQEIHLRPREVLSRTKVQEAQQRLLEIYRRMGRFGAKVDPKIIKLAENRVDLVFEIDEGPVTFVRSVQFVGNKAFSSKKLEEQLLTKRARWYRFFATDDVYDPDRFISDQQALRKFYYDNGYADFRITSALAELSIDQKDFVLTFSVDEGTFYKFGKIDVVSKLDSVKAEELTSSLECVTGDTFSGRLVEKTSLAITNAVGTKGFAFVSVEPKIEKNKETQTIDITFEVKEGPRVYIEKIVVTGNDRTRDEVIRREVGIFEGDAYNSTKIKEAEQRLKDLGYFKTVTVEPEQGTNPDQARLVVKVEEQSTGELGLAGGYSTLDGPLANVKIVERNFRGTGQIWHSDLTIAKKRQDFSVGVIEPYFLNRNLSASANIFSTRSTRFSAYHQITKGFDTGIGYRLSNYWTQSWTYTFKNDNVTHLSSGASQIIRSQAGSSTDSSVTHAIAYDRRDSRLNPTKGYVVSLATTYSGLGGTVSYLRNDLGISYFYTPIDDITLGLKGSVGDIQKVGNKTIRVIDSFMLGGESLRGFEYGGIGPRDKITGDSLGGTRYWSSTAELVFPIGLPNEFGIKGAVFSDFGSVWHSGTKADYVLDQDKMRSSAGFGISWTSPLGPIRLDYAFPLKKQKYDKTQRFMLGFSTRF